ncbi:MAG: hypothetical protein K940chlam9_00919 [Chlamydiae bacterium]|nr:hypothetical protein [Chlamydiota bacterium]
MRVDLLATDRKRYTFETYALEQVKKVLTKMGLSFQVIYLSDGLLSEYLSYRKVNPLSWSVSFSSLVPLGRSIVDLLPDPHFTWMRGTESSLLPSFSRSSARWGIPNKILYKELGSPNLLYLPHGVENVSRHPSRPFPVVFFGPVVDYARLQRLWEDWLGLDGVSQMHLCVERAWKGSLSSLQVVREMFGEDERIKALLSCVEEAIRVKIRDPLQRAFSEVPIHIFGAHIGENLLCTLSKNVSLHMELPYTEHFEVLKQAECIVMEEPTYWFFPALAAGALPFSPPTPELIEELGPSSPLYITDPKELEEKVKFYFQNPKEKEKLLASLQGHLAEKSWEKQVGKMVKFMSP